MLNQVAAPTTLYKFDVEMEGASNDEQTSNQPSIGKPDPGQQYIQSLKKSTESITSSISVSASTLTPEEGQRRKAMRQRRVLEWMIAVLCMSSSLTPAAH